MEKPSLDVVLQALDTLYSNKTDIDPTHKAQANQWLIQLTQSVSYDRVFIKCPPPSYQVHAWEVADQLLLLNRDIVTSQFAAQTMQSKVRYAFHELPPNTHTVSAHAWVPVNRVYSTITVITVHPDLYLSIILCRLCVIRC